jgi:hypothetical protein
MGDELNWKVGDVNFSNPKWNGMRWDEMGWNGIIKTST